MIHNDISYVISGSQMILPSNIYNKTNPNKRHILLMKVYSNVNWKNEKLIMNEQFIKLYRNTDLPPEIKKLQTPLIFFKQLLTMSLLYKLLFTWN